MLSSLLSAFARTRRVPKRGWNALTGKQKSNYNKGKRSMKTGVLDMYGRFHQVASMLPRYEVPDLSNFKLKPYVAHKPDGIDGTAASQAPRS